MARKRKLYVELPIISRLKYWSRKGTAMKLMFGASESLSILWFMADLLSNRRMSRIPIKKSRIALSPSLKTCIHPTIWRCSFPASCRSSLTSALPSKIWRATISLIKLIYPGSLQSALQPKDHTLPQRTIDSWVITVSSTQTMIWERVRISARRAKRSS